MRFSLSVEARVLVKGPGAWISSGCITCSSRGRVILTCPTLKKGREAFLKSGPASNLKGPIIMGQGSGCIRWRFCGGALIAATNVSCTTSSFRERCSYLCLSYFIFVNIFFFPRRSWKMASCYLPTTKLLFGLIIGNGVHM